MFQNSKNPAGKELMLLPEKLDNKRFVAVKKFFPEIVVWLILFLLLSFLARRLYIVFQQDVYPVVHMVIEFAIVIVAICVSLMSWYDYKHKHELRMLFLSLTFVMVAPLEFVHSISYTGMPDFISPNSVNKATTFWIIARLLFGAGLLAAAFSGNRVKVIRRSALIPTFFALLGILLIAAVMKYLPYLPAMYDPAAGSQTEIKIGLGYLLIAMQGTAIAGLLWKRKISGQDFYLSMALMTGIMSDIAFISYYDSYDTFNLTGHIYQVASFGFIFKAVIDEAVGMIYEKNVVLERQRKMLAEKNRQLQEADSLKDEFLANTNHELRTPLSAIIAFTEMLLDENTGKLNHLQRDYLNEICDSSQELLGRINGFLDLSKIAAGKVVLHREDFEAGELIEEVSARMRPLFNRKGITLETGLPLVLHVWADREKTGQVLTNLLSNALKFTAAGGKVTVDAGIVEPGCSEAYISVSDTGIGIDPKYLEKIFLPFQQLDGASSRMYGGTGIGLTLAKKLVELQGGYINVSSEINKGSIFKFSLPVIENDNLEKVS